MNNWSARQQNCRINRNNKTIFFVVANTNSGNRGFMPLEYLTVQHTVILGLRHPIYICIYKICSYSYCVLARHSEYTSLDICTFGKSRYVRSGHPSFHAKVVFTADKGRG